MRGWAGILAGFCLALASTTSGSALAAPSAKDKAEARALVQKAKAAARAKKWGEAIDAYKQADALDPSPQTELDLGRAQASAGKLVDAGKTFKRLADDPGKTAAAKKIKDSASTALADVKKRVAHVSVKSTPTDVKVSVDGAAADSPADIEVDPGQHQLSIEADGYESASKTVTVKESEKDEIPVTLTRAAGAVADAPKEAPSSDGPSRAPAVAAFVVGGVGLGVGGVFGALAFSATSDAKKLCNGNSCQPGAQDKIDASKRDGNISTVGFIVGGAGVATGVILLLVSGGKKSEPKADAGGAGAHVLPWIGPASAGLHGTF